MPLSIVWLFLIIVGRGCSPRIGVRPTSSLRSPSSIGRNALFPAFSHSHSSRIRSPQGVHSCFSGSGERLFLGEAFNARLISNMGASLRHCTLSTFPIVTRRIAISLIWKSLALIRVVGRHDIPITRFTGNWQVETSFFQGSGGYIEHVNGYGCWRGSQSNPITEPFFSLLSQPAAFSPPAFFFTLVLPCDEGIARVPTTSRGGIGP